MATTLGANDPFRYRGYYYDAETGLYYLQTRYYDPQVCRFVSADVYVSTGQGISGYNMYAYCFNNPAIFIDTKGTDVDWNTLAGGVNLLLVAGNAFAAVATVISGGCAAPLLVVVIAAATATAATVTATCGAAETVEAFTDHNFVRDDYMQGDVERYTTTRDTAATIATIGSMGLSMYSPTCFVAGTLVLTENGSIPIEQVQEGMLVYAADPDTGEQGLREVVQTFKNETNELVHVFTQDGTEIVTTPTHPFYSPIYGWTAAVDLRAGDILVTVNGEKVVVEEVTHELLENPVTVYNFEVEGLHTYFVSTDGVLVHNTCVVKQNGVEINSNYPNDHGSPAHLHVNGGGPSTKIGPNGYPVKGFPALTAKQAKVVIDNIQVIKKAIKVAQKTLRAKPW